MHTDPLDALLAGIGIGLLFGGRYVAAIVWLLCAFLPIPNRYKGPKR